MEHLHAALSASMAELKRNPAALLTRAHGHPIAIIKSDKPTAYLISADIYEKMIDVIENAELFRLAQDRIKDKKKAVRVNLDDL